MPGACATHNFAYLVSGPWSTVVQYNGHGVKPASLALRVKVTYLKDQNLQTFELTACLQDDSSLAGTSGQWHVTSATLGPITYFSTESTH